MRKLVFFLLLGTFLSGGLTISSLATPHAFAASHSSTDIPVCANTDYRCGYRQGQAIANSEVANGQCGGNNYGIPITHIPVTSSTDYILQASDLGFQDGFNEYCRT